MRRHRPVQVPTRLIRDDRIVPTCHSEQSRTAVVRNPILARLPPRRSQHVSAREKPPKVVAAGCIVATGHGGGEERFQRNVGLVSSTALIITPQPEWSLKQT